MRVLTSSFEYVQAVGRNMKYFVVDKVSKKYLGIVVLSSDVSRLPPRDNQIMWSKSNMFKDKKLNSSCIGQTIVPVQPFGSNMLGGKLCALMCGTDRVRDDWKKKYNDELVSMTTTSLYGSYSMYNSLPIWKKVGKTKGTIIIKPDDDYYFDWLEWLKENHNKEYQNSIKSNEGTTNPPTAVKQKLIQMMFRKLGIQSKKYQNEQSKGVYLMKMYDNSFEYLRNEIKSDELILSEKMNNEYLIDWWKTKAIKRYSRLHKNNQLKEQVLWYEDLTKKQVQGWLYSRGINYV